MKSYLAIALLAFVSLFSFPSFAQDLDCHVISGDWNESSSTAIWDCTLNDPPEYYLDLQPYDGIRGPAYTDVVLDDGPWHKQFQCNPESEFLQPSSHGGNPTQVMRGYYAGVSIAYDWRNTETDPFWEYIYINYVDGVQCTGPEYTAEPSTGYVYVWVEAPWSYSWWCWINRDYGDNSCSSLVIHPW